MDREGRSRIGTVASLVGLAAGIVVVIGSLLAWLTLSGGSVSFQGGRVGGSMNGLGTPFGFIALAAGAITAVACLWRAVRPQPWLGLLALLGSLVALVVGVFFVVQREARFIAFAADEAASKQLPGAKIRSVLRRAMDIGVVRVRPGLGLIVVIAAGAVGVLAALILLLGRRPEPAAGPSVAPAAPPA